MNLLKQPTPVNKLSYNAHTPTVGGLQSAMVGGQHSTMPRNYGNRLTQNVEPPSMAQVPQYLSRFVAGPPRLESNPLGEPLRNLRTLSPMSNLPGSVNAPRIPHMQDYDLNNPDV